jgi:hypothetical protein
MIENKYLKWIMNNMEYLILLPAIISLLQFTIYGLISAIVPVIIFFVVRRQIKKIKEKIKF